jgi:hypothetical protein
VTRDEVAARLLAALPGATLRGSRADGTADQYSDIDLRCDGPAERIPEIAEAVIGPLLWARGEGELLKLRFADLPLFARVDVEVPGASAFPDVPAQSAFENAVAALKEERRGHFEIASGLLERGHARIGSPGGDTVALAEAAAELDPRLRRLVEQLRAATVTDRLRTPRSA